MVTRAKLEQEQMEEGPGPVCPHVVNSGRISMKAFPQPPGTSPRTDSDPWTLPVGRSLDGSLVPFPSCKVRSLDVL